MYSGKDVRIVLPGKWVGYTKLQHHWSELCNIGRINSRTNHACWTRSIKWVCNFTWLLLAASHPPYMKWLELQNSFNHKWPNHTFPLSLRLYIHMCTYIHTYIYIYIYIYTYLIPAKRCRKVKLFTISGQSFFKTTFYLFCGLLYLYLYLYIYIYISTIFTLSIDVVS